MPFLTVFTPTFNRADTLHLNYEALKKQRDRDFVWMIVDDGSTDGTEELIRTWIKENIVPIVYHKQKNSGKPSATNYSIENSESTLWMCVDSDDYIADNAVAVIRAEYEVFSKNTNCIGLIGPKYNYQTNAIVGKTRSNELLNHRYVYYWEYVYKHKEKDDKIFIFNLNKLRQFRYPIIKGEKFIGESYIYDMIGNDFVFFITGEKMYYCSYLEDGLTSNYLKLHVNNPIGYKLLKKQAMVQPKPLIDQFRSAIMYVAGCLLCRDQRIVKDSPRRIMTLFALPFGVVAYYKKYARISKGVIQ